jgi:hypothetical protein
VIEIDDDLQHKINVKVLRAIDRAISDVTRVDRIWITDPMLPDFLPHLEHLIRRALDQEWKPKKK